jgi:hypothetical protein
MLRAQQPRIQDEDWYHPLSSFQRSTQRQVVSQAQVAPDPPDRAHRTASSVGSTPHQPFKAEAELSATPTGPIIDFLALGAPPAE